MVLMYYARIYQPISHCIGGVHVAQDNIDGMKKPLEVIQTDLRDAKRRVSLVKAPRPKKKAAAAAPQEPEDEDEDSDGAGSNGSGD